MKCPFCGYFKTWVIKTEKLSFEVLRLRQCEKCRKYFETEERILRTVSASANNKFKDVGAGNVN